MLSKIFFIVITSIAFIFATTKHFHAPSQISGNISINVHPMENVSIGDNKLITFSFPFTRGSITKEQLQTIRLFKNNLELSTEVTELTPWRHLNDESIDCKSVRFAQISFLYKITKPYPQSESIELEWGITNRTRDTTFSNNLIDWHLVTNGSFTVDDSIFEPDVYVTLPKEILSQGSYTLSQMLPSSDEMSNLRDNPRDMLNMTFNNLDELDYARKNFFYTIINEDDPLVNESNFINYHSEYEPWLYDRAATMFMLYFKTGFLRPLREAVQASQFYAKSIYLDTSVNTTVSNRNIGICLLKNPDPTEPYPDSKYSYNESFAYTLWTTGDTKLKRHCIAISNAFETIQTKWSPSLNFWTERHTAYKFQAAQFNYELFGDSTFTLPYSNSPVNFKGKLETCIEDFIWHQNGAGGQLPESSIDGGLYHYGAQHSWDWNPDSLGASPWMSILIQNTMVRSFGISESEDISRFIYRMGLFLKESCRETSYNGGMQYPMYVVYYNGSETGEENEWSDLHHSPEVGCGIAWSAYFGALLNEEHNSLVEQSKALYSTTTYDIRSFTRPDAPQSGLSAFRVTPPRRYSWEQRSTTAWSWLLDEGINTPINFIHKNNINSKLTMKLSVNGIIQINCSLKNNGVFKLYNLHGQCILKKDLSNLQIRNLILPVKDLAAGTYFISLKTTDQNIFHKFISY